MSVSGQIEVHAVIKHASRKTQTARVKTYIFCKFSCLGCYWTPLVLEYTEE